MNQLITYLLMCAILFSGGYALGYQDAELEARVKAQADLEETIAHIKLGIGGRVELLGVKEYLETKL